MLFWLLGGDVGRGAAGAQAGEDSLLSAGGETRAEVSDTRVSVYVFVFV